MSTPFQTPLFAGALPGARVTEPGENGMSATATNDYMYLQGDLFRRFAWCSFGICSAAFSSQGEWQLVPAHWKQYRKKTAA